VRVSAGEQAALPSFTGRKILAADDSAVNREVVQEALARLGVDATIVSGGRAAFSAVAAERFDLILMDCSMPEMDGYAATRAIREFEQSKGRTPTPIIALTAHVAGEDEEWRDAGMNHYLTKPFTMHALASSIQLFLKPTPAAAAPLLAPPTERAESRAPAAAAARAPIAAAAADPLDPKILAELAQMGGASLVRRALGLFETHSRGAMLQLAEAVQSADLEKIRSAAHALKSMSVNVGARSLGAACGDIESAARAGAPVAEIRKLMSAARAAFLAVHAVIAAAGAKQAAA
ncbi:MAG: response regulator, partial [Parvularculaceae bacterium]|nr:response regulator [Parvularculaceae bacterium]